MRQRLLVIAAVSALSLSVPVTALRAAPVDRAAAEWAIRMGGWVRIHGQSTRTYRVADLPEKDFRLKVLNLVGCNIDPPDLARLSSLSGLKELHLPGPMWNPRAGANKNQSKDLKHIAPLTTLEKLTFSYSFWPTFGSTTKASNKSPGWRTSRTSAYGAPKVEGRALAPFHNLESLDLTFTPFDDKGLANLKGMSRLKRLWIGDTLVTDDGLESLSGLTELEGTQPARNPHQRHRPRASQWPHPAQAPEPSRRRCDRFRLDHLKNLKDLEVINLYRTKVSNAGLDKLKEFTRLREMDLRYSRATGAGVAALQEAMPDTRLVFLDFSLRAADEGKAADAPQGESDEAVADWVRSLGGTATLDSGRLTEISLASTSLTDAHLEHLRHLKALRKLDLQVTEIGDLGAASLSALTMLEELNLSNTLISDAGLAHLAGLMTLRKLTLNNTLIEGEGLAHSQGVGQLAGDEPSGFACRQRRIRRFERTLLFG